MDQVEEDLEYLATDTRDSRYLSEKSETDETNVENETGCVEEYEYGPPLVENSLNHESDKWVDERRYPERARRPQYHEGYRPNSNKRTRDERNDYNQNRPRKTLEERAAQVAISEKRLDGAWQDFRDTKFREEERMEKEIKELKYLYSKLEKLLHYSILRPTDRFARYSK